jgi:acyl-CoA-binding protein
MSDLQSRFEAATVAVQQLPKRPDNNTLLKLYALYKQATLGDVRGARPGLGDFTDRMKYDAWARVKGMTQDAAMQGYVELVEQLRGK